MTTQTVYSKEVITPAFQLKGSLFTLTVLQLLDSHLERFSTQLKNMVEQAPKFFKNAPVVIDLNKLNHSETNISFSAMVKELRHNGLIPVGVRGGTAQQHQAALVANLPILTDSKMEPQASSGKSSPVESPSSRQSSKIITQLVRSGQQIYANGGDLVVLEAVSPGAELLADGHIHVYGPLRGRALAGVTGDQQARIFCHSLEAELVSIAGHYWIKEDLKTSFERQPVQIYLENDRLKIKTL